MLAEILKRAENESIESYKTKPHSAKEEMPEAFDEKRKRYPQLYLNDDVIPEIADWKDGEDYVVVLRLTQTGSSSHDGHASADFEIKEAAVIDADLEEEEDSEDEEAEDTEEEEDEEADDDSSPELKQYLTK